MADHLGVSEQTVARATGILDYPDLVQKVMDEEASLTEAYKTAVSRRKAAGENTGKRQGRPLKTKKVSVNLDDTAAAAADLVKVRLGNHPDAETFFRLLTAIEFEAELVPLSAAVVDDVSMLTEFVLRAKRDGYEGSALLGLGGRPPRARRRSSGLL